MGSRLATELLQLPLRLHGIRLGRPLDLLLDAAECDVVNGRSGLGELRDLVLAPEGTVEGLLVEQDEAVRTVRPTGMAVESRHVFPARG